MAHWDGEQPLENAIAQVFGSSTENGCQVIFTTIEPCIIRVRFGHQGET